MFADIKLRGRGGLAMPEARPFAVAAGATTINLGEPAKMTAFPYVVPSADAEPVTTTPTFWGIAASTSTQTASADGVVYITPAVVGLIYRAKAKSATAADTQAEIDALVGKRVVLDLTTGSYTVDTAAADAATNGVVIVGGDPNGSFIDFEIKSATNYFN